MAEPAEGPTDLAAPSGAGSLGRGRYLFAYTRGLDAAALQETAGLDSAPVELVDVDGLQAVVCTVDLAEYGEEALKQHLEDMAWLERVARTHNDVVYAVATRAAVAPMRLVTIYHDDASVRARTEEMREQLTEVLERVEGRCELSVKAYAVPEEEQAPAPAASREPGSGAAYLQRKRQRATQRQAAGEQAAQTAHAISERLAEAAEDHRVLPPQDPRLTGRKETMTLNAAYLVPLDAREDFAELVRQVAAEHPEAQVQLDGPWPPYSFATLE